VHAPPTHVEVPPHAVPHAPQLASSEDSSTHAPLQSTVPAAHVTAQTPAEQTCPVAQAAPHLPQLLGSVWRLSHDVPHAVSPAAHPQAPFSHCSVPGQLVPQVPQFESFVWRSTHALLQSVRPVAHVALQALFEQTSPLRQTTLHPPQLTGSLVGSTHAPLHTVPVAHTEPSAPPVPASLAIAPSLSPFEPSTPTAPSTGEDPSAIAPSTAAPSRPALPSAPAASPIDASGDSPGGDIEWPPHPGVTPTKRRMKSAVAPQREK
jgi:hypothetical protein